MLSRCVDVMCVLYSLLSSCLAWYSRGPGGGGGGELKDIVQVVKQSYVVAWDCDSHYRAAPSDRSIEPPSPSPPAIDLRHIQKLAEDM